jgi:phosphatidylserine/phosphatidylglycerophosphate/cardiolipin synthase-like enzyme
MRLSSVLPVVLLVVGLAAGFGGGAMLRPVTVTETSTTTQPVTTIKTTMATIYQTLTQTTTSSITQTIRETLLRTTTTTYHTSYTTTKTVTTTTTAIATTTLVESGVSGVCFSRVEQCDVVLISLINRANRSVYVAIYSFTRDGLAAALVSAKNRGVEVRVVIERDRANEQGSEYQYLRSAGVSVRLDGNSGLMHHKFMVIDGLIVVTGSYNWSTAAEDRNDENIVIIRDRYIAERFTQEFERIWRLAS